VTATMDDRQTGANARRGTGAAWTGSTDIVGVGLIAFGVYHLALGIFMVVAPGAFFTEIGPFGVQNDHYIRDNATFPLAIGAGLLIAAGRPSWRFPVLLVAAVWYLAHAVNHLVDIGESDPDWVGPVDFVVILLSGLALLWLALVAARYDVRASDRGRRPPV
jgi:hypothetical protein